MALLKGWMRRKMYDLLIGDDAGPVVQVHETQAPGAAENAAPRGAEPVAPADGAGDTDELAELEARMGRFFQSVDQGNRQLSAGKLQIVDLAGLRDQLGGYWEKGGELVHQLATGVIKRHLDPADVMSRHRDDSYILLFARLSEDEAKIKAKLIADEIEERLLGASSGKHAIKVKSVVAHVDGTVGFAELDGEALIERLMTEAEEQFAQFDESLNGSREADAAELLEQRYAAVFSPVWYVPKHVVSSDLCEIETRDGGSILDRIPDAATREAIDHFALRHSVTRLVDTLTRGEMEVVIVPVHYATLMDDHSRGRYLEAMSKVPADCRRLICHEVLKVPNEIAPARFNSVMATLKRYTRSIMCRVALDFRGFRLIDPPAVHALGVHLHRYRGKESGLIPRLQSFARDAEARGFKPSVFGLRTRSQAVAALGAGFVYVHGDPVKAESGGISSFALADLYTS